MNDRTNALISNAFRFILILIGTLYTVVLTSFIIVFGEKLLIQGYTLPRVFCIFYSVCILIVYLYWAGNVTFITKGAKK